MRISTAYQFSSYESAIQNSMQTMLDAQNQVETGKALNKPSDNPTGTASVINMQSLQDAITQYTKNIGNAKSWLNSTDNALSSITTTLQQGYQAALQGATASTTDTTRATLATQVQDLQTTLVNLANSKSPTGQYLFAGQVTQTAPFTVGAGGLVYNGDSQSISMEGSPTQQVDVNTVGSPLITNAYNALQAIKLDLQNNNLAGLSGLDVTNIQSSMSAVSVERGNVGAKINTATDLESQNSQRAQDLTTSMSNITDVDMTKAITNYQQAYTAYQAALSVASKGFGNSLLDYIKGIA